MSEDVIYRTMLFDYYGDFLTEKQKLYFDLHYNNDLSLAEISEQNGVSKQAVWDNIRHAEATLRRVEEKLALVKRSMEMKELLGKATEYIEKIVDLPESGRKMKTEALDLIRQAQDLY